MMEQPLTIAERTYRTVRDLIISGELGPGDRLVQQQLAKRIGTSHIPVIEAIRRLEREGLVVYHPNWGAQVRLWTLDDIETAYALREALEGRACRLFTERATPADRVALQEYGKQYDTASREMDQGKVDEIDLALHMYIITCARSPLLRQLAESTSVMSALLRNWLNMPPPASDDFGPIGIHDELISALIDNDADLAEEKLKEHIRFVLNKVRNFLHSAGYGLHDPFSLGIAVKR